MLASSFSFRYAPHMQNRTPYDPASHVAGVEKFYGRGVEHYGDYHRGYLNFGLWDDGNTDYVTAAEHLITTMADRVGLNADSYLIDAANGMGTQDVFFAKKYGCRIQTIDATWKHVEHARRRAEDAGVADNVTNQHGDATHLPFPDATFTHAMCVEGAEHFDTREAYLKDAYRVLKPGGKIVQADYSLTKPLTGVFATFLVRLICKVWHVPTANIMTPEEFKTCMERIGYKNVNIELIGARTIPGYVKEAMRPESLRAQSKIRGWLVTHLFAKLGDETLLTAFNRGLVEYLLVTGEK